MSQFSQFQRIIIVEKFIMFPVKIISFVSAVILFRYYQIFTFAHSQFFQYQLSLYVLGNLMFAYVLVTLGQRKFRVSFVQISAFFLTIIDSLFLSILVYITEGATSNLYWVYSGLMIRNAFNFQDIREQSILNISFLSFYVGASLAERTNLPVDYQEIFVMRIIVLLLLIICCWGITAMLKKRKEEEGISREIKVRQQKLFSTGKMASEVAHGLKNPLAIINNASYSLQKLIPDSNEKLNQLSDIIREEVDRADRLLKSLLDYSRQSLVQIKKLNVNEFIIRCVDHARPNIMMDGIVFNYRFEKDLPPLYVDDHHLNQIFSNLIHNAAEATYEE